MIITKIETFPLSIPFKADTGVAASAWGECRTGNAVQAELTLMEYASSCTTVRFVGN
jgi:hypothetical protein